MADFLKDIQSTGRGFRPGMEVKLWMNGQYGKSVIMDFESDHFTDWEHVLLPHWAEHTSEDGERVWRSYTKKPVLSHLYRANRVVRKNKDGSFEYIKNRDGMGERILNEQEEKEFLFVILKSEPMYK